jgi:hypothetical protein
MSYDLAICRSGALAAFESPISEPLIALTPHDDVREAFTDQRERITNQRAYDHALRAIESAAKVTFDKRLDDTDPDVEFSIFSMPPTVDLALDEDLEQSSHLVGLLPSEMMTVTLGDIAWRVRARASVTACALEVAHGLPKMWWTFEGVPADPDPDRRPTETDIARFLGFARALESPAIDHLTTAYFGALREVTRRGEDFKFTLGNDRVRIRFADSNDATYEALIYALRYRGLNAAQIEGAEPGRLETAKRGLGEFTRLVDDTNPPGEPGIDPATAYVNDKIRIVGVDAVSARHECRKSQSIWIAGVAQRPGSRTAYDHLPIVRDQLLDENDEQNLRDLSAARRLTGHLAGIEALRLEKKRRLPGQTVAPII